MEKQQFSHWIEEFKIAIINEDSLKLEELYDGISRLDELSLSLEELQTLEALLPQGIEILKDAKSKLGADMSQVKASIAYQKNMIN